MHSDEHDQLRVVVAIATAGRPHILHHTVNSLLRQTRLPDRIHICAPSEADVESIDTAHASVKVTIGVRGSCVQRNAIIKDSYHFDVIIFLDDDFLPRKDYVMATAKVFVDYPDVVLTTGHVIADGVIGPGLDIETALLLLERDSEIQPQDLISDIHNGYGCNMAARIRTLRDHSIDFDEDLPLYGWLEDVDISRQLARFGRVISTPIARGVHMGDKRGRQVGKRLGYSQIANPVYLARKGSISWNWALNQLGRNVAANFAHSISPEPWVDRRGRLMGHAYALMDLVSGKLHPRRILEL